MQPHRWQPIRLPHPWDSPGKNTGVGCHFLLQCMKVKSESEVAQSCKTLSDPMDCSLPAPPPMGFSRQEYWNGVPLPSPSAKLMICNFKFCIFTLTKISTLRESFPDHLWMTAEQSIDYLKKRYNLVTEDKINPGGFSYSEERWHQINSQYSVFVMTLKMAKPAPTQTIKCFNSIILPPSLNLLALNIMLSG